MARPLPPRPDLTQLKHQAKDLLRAHERKDPGACPPLRRLRRFASADDAGILAGGLALHEAHVGRHLERRDAQVERVGLAQAALERGIEAAA